MPSPLPPGTVNDIRMIAHFKWLALISNRSHNIMVPVSNQHRIAISITES